MTQPEAASRAGVSLATWRRWEEDPETVSADTRRKCERVVDVNREVRSPFADHDLKFERSWGDCPYLTPRQACAVASVLALWAEEIDEWLDGGWLREPLHAVPPFSRLDCRVMIYVNDNKAWAAKAQERCYAVASEIAEGVLPFDREGCFFDELLMAVALPLAEELLTQNPEVFEDFAPRLPTHEDEVHFMVADEFDDRCRWDEWEVPTQNDHQLLAAVLAGNHPYTWFDPSPGTDPGYIKGLANTANEEAPD
jgi:hypothetical protein